MLLRSGHLTITHWDSSSSKARSSGSIVTVKVPHAMLSIETKLLKNKTQVLGSELRNTVTGYINAIVIL